MTQEVLGAARKLPTAGAVAAARQTRLAQLAQALEHPAPRGSAATVGALGDQLLEMIDPRDHSQVWLTLAVMTGVLPSDEFVVEVGRESEFDGGLALAEAVTRALQPANARLAVLLPEPGTVLLDVTTALAVHSSPAAEKVVREATPRWVARGAIPVVWLPGGHGIRLATEPEKAAIADGRSLGPVDKRLEVSEVIVPWQCTYVTAEVFAQVARADRTRGLARFGQARTAAVVHDCAPVTFGETRNDWRTDPFEFYLSALAHFDQLIAGSVAAGAEFRGWRLALSATGVAGPEIDEVMLPAGIVPAGEAALADTRDLLMAADGPVVVVVGSREVRTNDLAVLHASELLWRKGHGFRLVFLGVRARDANDFDHEVARLRAVGRSIDIVNEVNDELIAAAYGVARFTLFPSLGEGFGHPVAESLTVGTPVITSSYGAVREIAEAGGGALLVDPRDDHAIADAMESLLADDSLLDRLRDQARARPLRTWDTYCREAWALLAGSEEVAVR